jgi:hypothetical protein
MKLGALLAPPPEPPVPPPVGAGLLEPAVVPPGFGAPGLLLLEEDFEFPPHPHTASRRTRMADGPTPAIFLRDWNI